MIRYQLGTTIRELVALRARSALLIVLVLIVNFSLPYTLNDVIRGIGNLRAAAVLAGGDVTYFTIFYDDSKPPVVNQRVDDLLSSVLDGRSNDYSIVKNNFFYDGTTTAPLVVALGGFQDAYGFSVHAEGNAVLLGSKVSGYDVGDRLAFGGLSAVVAGTFPEGAAYLDPWIGQESLDELIVLVSSYEDFSAAVPPDVWQQEALGRAVLFGATEARVTEFVEAAASTGGLGLVPQDLEARVAHVYQAQLERSEMFLIFFVCLVGILGVTVFLALNSLVAGNLRRYSIERLYGASTGHLTFRASLFVFLSFSLPTLLIFGSFSLFTENIAGILVIVGCIVLVIQVLLSFYAAAVLSRSNIVDQFRRE